MCGALCDLLAAPHHLFLDLIWLLVLHGRGCTMLNKVEAVGRGVGRGGHLDSDPDHACVLLLAVPPPPRRIF